MRQFLLYSLITFLLSTLQILSQESGWVDSAGYKQQRYKTGEIKQLLYTSTGDTIITVTKDSVWHRYLWDTKSGRLLDEKKISRNGYKRIFSFVISPSGKSYTVSALNSDNTIHVHTFSIKEDTLVHDIQINKEKVDSCFAHYFDETGILWVGINSVYNSDEYTRKREGLLQQYRIHDGDIDTLFSHNSYTYRFASSSDGKSCSWLSISMYFKYNSKFQTIIDTTKIFENFKNDSLVYSKKVLEGIKAEDIHTEELLTYKITDFILLSNDGEHKFYITQNTISHYLVPNNIHIHTHRINNLELQSNISLDNQYILCKYKSKAYIYHIISKKFIDTLEISPTTNLITHQGMSLLTALNSGYMRLYELDKKKLLQRSSIALIPQLSYEDSINVYAVNHYKSKAIYKWDFGNGDIRYGNWVNYSHSNPGKYIISVKIIQNIDTSTILDTIQILPQLVPDFDATPRFGGLPLTVKFIDKSNGDILRRVWNFGDGTIDSINKSPIHQYITASMPLTVSLTVFDTLSKKTFTKFNYINPVQFSIENISYLDVYHSPEINYNLTDYRLSYVNSYRKGLYTGNTLLLYKYNCTHEVKRFAAQETDYYHPIQSITDTNNIAIITLSPSSVPSPFQKCDNKHGEILLLYRNNKVITSFEGFQSQETKDFINSGIYVINGRNFAPSGWSHDFNGVFLPDGTDIFLFRNKQSNLQFFYNDTTAFHRLDFSAQFSDIFAMPDSLSCVLFTNPAFDLSDSTNSFILNTLDNKGNLLREVKIPKTINAAITCLRPLDHDSFFIAGYTGTRNDKGQIIDKKGYIALININGFIEWQNTIPTYSDIRTIQKHPNNYFAALGLPHANQKHGFIAFKENGKILADFRLFDAHSSFYPNDFIIGNKEHDIWFIGEEYIENQGKRATVYSCNNPVTPTTDIDESQPLTLSNNDMTVFPNPAHDLITLTNVSEKYSIFDSMGNVLMHSHSDRLDISHLPNGLYFIKSHTISSKTMSFIIQR